MLAYVEDRHVPALQPQNVESPTACEISLAQLLGVEFDTDAHYVAHRIAHNQRWLPPHRVSKTAMGSLHAADPAFLAYNHFLILDLDNYAGVDPVALREFLPEKPTVYQTKHGAHVLWPFLSPCPAWLYKSVCSKVGQMVQGWVGSSVKVDPAAWEWDRIFRCPRATREGRRLQPAVAEGSGNPLDWSAFDPEPEQKWVKVKGVAAAPAAADEIQAVAHALLPKVIQSLQLMGDQRGARVVQGLEWLGDDGDRNSYLLGLTGRLALILQHDVQADEHVICELLRQSCDLTPQTEDWHQTTLRLASHAWHNQAVEARATAPETWPTFEEPEQPVFLNGATGQPPSFQLPIGTGSEPVIPRLWIIRDRKQPTVCWTWNVLERRYVREAYSKLEIHAMCESLGLPIFCQDIADRFPSLYQRCLALIEKDEVRASVNTLESFFTCRLFIEHDGSITEPHFDGWMQEVSALPAKIVMPGARFRLDIPPAEFVPWCDRWLQSMFQDNYPLFEQWVVRFPRLNLPTAALFLIGHEGCGKSMLTTALAHFFVGHCSFRSAVGQFNESLLNTPVVVAAEQLVVSRREGDAAARFREFLDTESTHTINPKGTREIEHRVNPRLLGSFNSSRKLRLLLGYGDKDEVSATLKRAFVQEIMDGEALKQLIPKPDEIDAEQFRQLRAHLRYLMEYKPLQPETGRFGQVPRRDEINTLAFRKDTDWLLSALDGLAADKDLQITAGSHGQIYRVEDEIWVTSSCIDAGLRRYARCNVRWREMRSNYTFQHLGPNGVPYKLSVPGGSGERGRFYRFQLGFLEELAEATGSDIEHLYRLKTLKIESTPSRV